MYNIIAVTASGSSGRYYLTARGTWVHTMRSGEAARFASEDMANRVAADMQEGLSTRIVKVVKV